MEFNVPCFHFRLKSRLGNSKILHPKSLNIKHHHSNNPYTWTSKASGRQTHEGNCNYIFEKLKVLRNSFNKNKSVGYKKQASGHSIPMKMSLPCSSSSKEFSLATSKMTSSPQQPRKRIIENKMRSSSTSVIGISCIVSLTLQIILQHAKIFLLCYCMIPTDYIGS